MPTDDRLPFQRRHLDPRVGAALRRAREGLELSRREVAVATGIASKTLARIERGAQKPSWTTLEALCDHLGVSVVALAPRWFADSMDVPASAAVVPGVGLRVVRRARGLTLKRLAGISGVSAATLSRHERGLVFSRLLDEVGWSAAGEAGQDGYARLARPLGFADADALRAACLAAAP